MPHQRILAFGVSKASLGACPRGIAYAGTASACLDVVFPYYVGLDGMQISLWVLTLSVQLRDQFTKLDIHLPGPIAMNKKEKKKRRKKEKKKNQEINMKLFNTGHAYATMRSKPCDCGIFDSKCSSNPHMYPFG
jgi:hypothetical protein